MEGLAIESSEPQGAILVVAMLAQYSALRLGGCGLSLFAEDVVSGQDVMILCSDFVGLPVVAPLIHNV